mmetsp:Transcript_2694/g.4864  ORF Transcript_2694/g.4864 Transcript_2694/m.4864 type:complete len:94 (+) Transcript_2694:74-355(+)
MKLYIEYCPESGYTSRFSQVAEALEKEFSGKIVCVGNTKPPRRGSFEIFADDGSWIHSTLGHGSLPTPEEIVDKIRHKMDRAQQKQDNASHHV